jgi:hypothetical protein
VNRRAAAYVLDRAATNVVDVAVGAWNHARERRVVTRRGERLYGVVVQDRLAGRRLDVDRGGFTGDGDRFLERADAQVGINGRRCRAGDGDAVPLDRVEPREGERHAISSGPQIDDLKTPVAVSDCRANLLDENRARCFNGDAGQNRARRVLNHACNRRLSQRYRRD